MENNNNMNLLLNKHLIRVFNWLRLQKPAKFDLKDKIFKGQLPNQTKFTSVKYCIPHEIKGVNLHFINSASTSSSLTEVTLL